MTQLTIAQLINSGAHDSELDQIEAAVRQRRQSQIFTLTPGQDVWITSAVRTGYLRGRHCKVVQVNRVRVVLTLVNPHPGERFQGRFTCPSSILTSNKPTYAED